MRKSKNKNIRIRKCKICLKKNIPLLKGHIIPDWVQRISSLKGDEANVVDMNNLNGDVSKFNNTANLFCGDCERWLGEGEAELRRTFLSRNHSTDDITSTVHPITFSLYEIDAPRRKLIERGIAGIIFKGHFLNTNIFINCFFPKKKFKMFRNALLKGGPECDNFDFMHFNVIKMLGFGEPNPMSMIRIAPLTNAGTALIFAGLCIKVSYSSYKQNHTKDRKNLRIIVTDIQYLGFPFNEFPNFNSLRKFLNDENDQQAFREAIIRQPDDSFCPCGLYLTHGGKPTVRRIFGECCKPMWFSSL